MFRWAEYRRTKGAVKLHLLLNHDGYLPSYALITNGKKSDVKMARKFPLAKGSIVAMDRGYNDYKLFADWTENGIYFVTRLKNNADFIVVKERKPPKNSLINQINTLNLLGLKQIKNVPTFFVESLHGIRKTIVKLFY